MLIVGLGNPGDAYKETKHNVGFKVVDSLLNSLKPTPINKREFKGELYKVSDFFLLKPQTFMNLSGESVEAVCSYYNIENLVVIHDDIDLGLGVLRFKKGGGSGGHNGLKSIDKKLGSDYTRVRIGVGKPEDTRFEISDYVLSKFSTEEQKIIDTIIERAKQAVISLMDGESLERVKSNYSQKADATI